MLRRASVSDLREGRVSKDSSYIVVPMRFYPRGIARELVDEYVRELAPSDELFSEFKARERKLANHNSSFYLVNYESRFAITPEGWARLEEFSTFSREREVVLICQCRDFDRCHCDLLLLTAQKRFGAEIKGLIFDYPIYRERLEKGEV
jgi:uncharacterized protein YeaO (DUF488 family)